jgi:hypothetical protein
VDILLRVYAKCIFGQQDEAKRRIEEATRPKDEVLMIKRGVVKLQHEFGTAGRVRVLKPPAAAHGKIASGPGLCSSGGIFCLRAFGFPRSRSSASGSVLLDFVLLVPCFWFSCFWFRASGPVLLVPWFVDDALGSRYSWVL